MTIVVTGAAGFIGRHLVRALAQRDHAVVGVDRRAGIPPEATVAVQADLADDRDGVVDDLLRDADAVFHLAAFAGVRERGHGVEARRRRDNVDATRRVVDTVPAPVPLIVTSSSSVYGGSNGRACAETDTPAPAGGYARSKLDVERLCARRVSRGGHVAVARPFTVVGEGQRPDMAIAQWIAAARAGEPLPVYGSLERTRDVTDVRDVVEGLLRIADRGVRATVNLGTGAPQRLREIIGAVGTATGTAPAVVVRPASREEVPHTWADTRRCEALLGFVPQTDLLDVVRRQAAASERLPVAS